MICEFWFSKGRESSLYLWRISIDYSNREITVRKQNQWSNIQDRIRKEWDDEGICFMFISPTKSSTCGCPESPVALWRENRAGSWNWNSTNYARHSCRFYQPLTGMQADTALAIKAFSSTLLSRVGIEALIGFVFYWENLTHVDFWFCDLAYGVRIRLSRDQNSRWMYY